MHLSIHLSLSLSSSILFVDALFISCSFSQLRISFSHLQLPTFVISRAQKVRPSSVIFKEGSSENVFFFVSNFEWTTTFFLQDDARQAGVRGHVGQPDCMPKTWDVWPKTACGPGHRLSRRYCHLLGKILEWGHYSLLYIQNVCPLVKSHMSRT